MRITVAAALVSLCCLTDAAVAAETLAVKEGMWETTTVLQVEGLQIPPALLQNLPEKQRAQIERFDGRPHADRTCVTRKDIEEGFARFDKQSACKRDVISSTPRLMEANITCTGMMAGTGTARIEAPTATKVRGAAALQGALGKMTATLEARWLSATCAAPKN